MPRQSAARPARNCAIHIELIDLDPLDGITPALTVTQAYWINASNAGADHDEIYWAGTTELIRFDGVTRSTATDTQFVTTALVANPDAVEGDYLMYSSQNYRAAQFVLTPHTGMRFSGSGAVSNAHSGWTGVNESSLVLNAWLADDGMVRQSIVQEYRTFDGDLAVDLTGYLYTDGLAHAGQFSLQSKAYLAGHVSAVPEPAIVPLLLAGMLTVGVAARRRSTPAHMGKRAQSC